MSQGAGEQKKPESAAPRRKLGLRYGEASQPRQRPDNAPVR